MLGEIVVMLLLIGICLGMLIKNKRNKLAVLNFVELIAIGVSVMFILLIDVPTESPIIV